MIRRRNKYGVAPVHKRTNHQGVVFDSKGEMERYEALRQLQLAGHIRNLRRQVKYELKINGVHVGFYTPDFVYEERHGAGWVEIKEDFKGKMTRDAQLRIRVFEAIYGTQVRITRAK